MFERPSQLFDLNKRFRTKWRRPYIFQTINNVRSNNISLKYQRLTPPGCIDIGFGKFDFVAKANFFRNVQSFKFN